MLKVSNVHINCNNRTDFFVKIEISIFVRFLCDVLLTLNRVIDLCFVKTFIWPSVNSYVTMPP